MAHNEPFLITNIREWAPLNELFSKIPASIHRGLFSSDLNITCIDVLPEFIALGTDGGIVFWYSRCNGEVQKLRNESNNAITCVKICSTVEYLVAAGCCMGQVSVFQIQKEHPPDLNLATTLNKQKPIERYTIRDLHQSPIRCVEWSKNGMKLFSGDKQGIVVLTEFDFQVHLSKSMEILNEAYDMVQMHFCKPWLLISTVYRAIVCQQEIPTNCSASCTLSKWKVSQIGKKDRRVLSEFGVTFTNRSKTSVNIEGISTVPSIICSRPGYRFWLADTQGNVAKTLLFKDAMTRPGLIVEVPILNPGRRSVMASPPPNFGRCLMYTDQIMLTFTDNLIYFLDLERIKVVGSIRRLRHVIDVSICNTEIFILEEGRSIIRLAPTPEPPNRSCSKTIFNPIYLGTQQLTGNGNRQFPVVEFEAEEEAVNAEECFELPPIEHIDLKTPLTHESSIGSDISEHNLLQQDKMLLEHSKKVQIFEKISQEQFEDSILFKAPNKEHKAKKKLKKLLNTSKGIVEIGQQAKIDNGTNKLTVRFPNSTSEKPTTSATSHLTNITTAHSEETRNSHMENDICLTQQITTRPCLLEASFCDGLQPATSFLSSNTINKELEEKEKQLADVLQIEPIELAKPSPPILHNETSPTSFQYTPITYPLDFIKLPINHSSPTKRLHFIDENESRLSQRNNDGRSNEINKSISLKFTTANLINSPIASTSPVATSNDLPDVKRVPDSMNIPKLWNKEYPSSDSSRDESDDGRSADPDNSSATSSNGWEFVNP